MLVEHNGSKRAFAVTGTGYYLRRKRFMQLTYEIFQVYVFLLQGLRNASGLRCPESEHRNITVTAFGFEQIYFKLCFGQAAYSRGDHRALSMSDLTVVSASLASQSDDSDDVSV